MNKKIQFFFENVPQVILWIAVVAAVGLTLPTIGNNVHNPNMVVYFNADEGGLMDVCWSYFSGEKRETFQWDADYGLLMVYLADIARFFPKAFMQWTPGTFVLILRWIYLIAWILCFFALWRLVFYHFGSRWQATLAVGLLAVRPAFAYLVNCLKPEPVVLLFIIAGLDYTLRIVENPADRKNLFFAIACASLAFLTKYAGVFLLPSVVAAMYFSCRYQKQIGSTRNYFPRLKASWIFPALVGGFFILLPLVIISFYVRKASGMTWIAEFGFWRSLQKNRFILYLLFAGLCLIVFSFLILLLRRTKSAVIKRMLFPLEQLDSYALRVSGIFAGFSFLFGLRWLIDPAHFIRIYGHLGPTASYTTATAAKGIILSLATNLMERITEFDVWILAMFIFYLCGELYYYRRLVKKTPLLVYKRLVLLSFLAAPFCVMVSILRMVQHHMLPFFVVAALLSIQGVVIWDNNFKPGFCNRVRGKWPNSLSGQGVRTKEPQTYSVQYGEDAFASTTQSWQRVRDILPNIYCKFRVKGSKLYKNALIILLAALFTGDIVVNARAAIQSRLYQFNQHKDIAFEMEEWWHKNIPQEAKVAADHYAHVYIPSGYQNVRTLHWNGKDRPRQLRRLVDEYQPRFIYYNEADMGDGPMGPLESILPDKTLRRLKVLDSAGRLYQRNPQDKFMVYEVLDYYKRNK